MPTPISLSAFTNVASSSFFSSRDIVLGNDTPELGRLGRRTITAGQKQLNRETMTAFRDALSSTYGAIGEQMREFDRLGIAYDITPGVSAFAGAAAALKTEYTLPGVSQTVIVTRAAGRTPVPEAEKLSDIRARVGK